MTGEAAAFFLKHELLLKYFTYTLRTSESKTENHLFWSLLKRKYLLRTSYLAQEQSKRSKHKLTLHNLHIDIQTDTLAYEYTFYSSHIYCCVAILNVIYTQHKVDIIILYLWKYAIWIFDNGWGSIFRNIAKVGV